MADNGVFLDPDYVRFYDWAAAAHEEHVPFYARLAQQNDGPVMEVGCGTGRLSVALGREGFRVVGFDPSREALAIARRRLEEEPEPVQRRVSFLEGDIERFDLGEQFALALLAHSAVFRLSGRHSLLQCFRVLYEHTRPGGTAVVDAVAPEQMKSRGIGSEEKVAEGPNPATGLTTWELQRVTGIAWDTRTLRVEHDFVE
ncbi:MAG: class I SAM-dependent methyltransferase, partial [Candidatus Brocadiaceae bacterium]